MEIFYDSTITKLKKVVLPQDEEQVLKLIADRAKTGRAMVVKLKDSGGATTEISEFVDITTQAANRGLAPTNLVVEIIVRDPTTFGVKPAQIPKDIDRNDENTFQWGGERGIGNTPRHIMQNSPMFFRHNGSAVDLVNLHPGRGIFLICNGPSFNLMDHSLLKRPGIATFGINNGAQLFRPNYWACVDSPYRFCESIWKDPTIQKFVPQSHFWKQIFDVNGQKYGEFVYECPNVIGYRRNEWFRAHQFLTEGTVNWGSHKDRGGCRSVMLAAIRMIHLMGFKRVYLLGCDFHMSEDKRYFFDEQRTNAAIGNNNSSYTTLKARFKDLQPLFLEDGFVVHNCSPGSALDAFPMMNFQEAIEIEAVDTSQSTYGMYCSEGERQAAMAAGGMATPPTDVPEDDVVLEEQSVEQWEEVR